MAYRKNYYKLLGINLDTSREITNRSIKNAYLRAVERRGLKYAPEESRLLREACDVLLDPAARAFYDVAGYVESERTTPEERGREWRT